MANFYARYPANDSSILPTGSATAANQVLEIAQLTAIDTKVLTDAQLRASPVPVSGSFSQASVGINGATAPTSSDQVGGVGLDGNLHPLSVSNTGVLNVSSTPASGSVQHVIVDSSALPTGAATSAIQTNGTQVTQISGTVPLPTGAATEATLAAFSAKTAGALVPQSFDYQAITYVSTTTQINTVTFKLGGSGGTTVRTLTMGYDGSNRLTSVTAS